MDAGRERPGDMPATVVFLPKAYSVLRAGYGLSLLRRDLLAGLTVAIVALPLAMALAIASGVSPDKGLLTAIVAGFLISALGGSRFQIGGPTGAFIPVVFAVVVQHGYDGLVLATLMAGAILVLAGLLRVGKLMRFMPQPLITGFTSGIAVIIFASQLPELLGVNLESPPAALLPKLASLAQQLDAFNPWALGLAVGSAALILLLRRFAPTAPGFLVAVLCASWLVAVSGMPVDTIGTRFGGIPSTLPLPVLPQMSVARMLELLPAALTIAFLAGVESLLSAVVADGMTGGRHRSNTELIAQGIANGGSALFGGLPATGAIARTATNIRAGGVTPVSGMLHALFILVFVLWLSDWARYVPLPALAGVLVVVAWNMSEHRSFRHTLGAPWGDRLVLLATFVLTIAVDLTVAIQVGMVLAAFVFLHRMASAVEVRAGVPTGEDEVDREDDPILDQREALPPGVEVFRMSGPLFFGATDRLDGLLDRFFKPPKVFILRMRLVPVIDASGVHALASLVARCRRQGIALVISGLQPQPRRILAQMKLGPGVEGLHFAGDYQEAVRIAGSLLSASTAAD